MNEVKEYYEKALELTKYTLEQVQLGKITDISKKELEKRIKLLEQRLFTIGG